MTRTITTLIAAGSIAFGITVGSLANCWQARAMAAPVETYLPPPKPPAHKQTPKAPVVHKQSPKVVPTPPERPYEAPGKPVQEPEALPATNVAPPLETHPEAPQARMEPVRPPSVWERAHTHALSAWGWLAFPAQLLLIGAAGMILFLTGRTIYGGYKGTTTA